MADASFKDGKETPLRLLARDKDDLQIISTMIQDAIADRKEMLFEKNRQTFSLLLKRFRWEDAYDAENLQRPYERVQTVLMIRSALAVKTLGINMDDSAMSFELLSIEAHDSHLILYFAGNGEIKIDVECIDVVLSDVSRPYTAKSKSKPEHQKD